MALKKDLAVMVSKEACKRKRLAVVGEEWEFH